MAAASMTNYCAGKQEKRGRFGASGGRRVGTKGFGAQTGIDAALLT